MALQTVIALYRTAEEARYAVSALLLRKYDPSDIRVVARDLAALHETPPGVGQIVAGALGTVAGLAAFGIPYAGPVLAAAPMLGAVASVGKEEIDDADWFSRALGRLGVPLEAADQFAAGVREGGAVVLVTARDVTAGDVAALLADCNAVDVHTWDRPEARTRRSG